MRKNLVALILLAIAVGATAWTYSRQADRRPPNYPRKHDIGEPRVIRSDVPGIEIASHEIVDRHTDEDGIFHETMALRLRNTSDQHVAVVEIMAGDMPITLGAKDRLDVVAVPASGISKTPIAIPLVNVRDGGAIVVTAAEFADGSWMGQAEAIKRTQERLGHSTPTAH